MQNSHIVHGLIALSSLACLGLADEPAPTFAPPAIIGTVDDGTPTQPAAVPEKPTFEIQSTVVRPLAGKSITMHKVAPLVLPAASPLPALEITDVAVQTQLEEREEQAPQSTIVFLSSTVYGHSKSLVRWWHEGQEYAAWSNLDFGHLCGFSSVRVKDTDYGLLMGLNDAEASSAPQHPTLPTNGPGFVLVKGDQNNPAAMALIEGLHELYRTEGERLRLAYEGRESARIQKEEELRANPPQPKNTVIHFWKREKSAPATPTEGGAKQ